MQRPSTLGGTRSRHGPVPFPLLLTILLLVGGLFFQSESVASLAEGRVAFQKGHYELAAQLWEKAAAQLERENDAEGCTEAWINLGAAYGALGQQEAAMQVLSQAVELARAAHLTRRLAEARAALGRACGAKGLFEPARAHLEEALDAARATTNVKLESAIRNDLGNLSAARRRWEEALQQYQEAARLARQQGDPLLAARAACNAAVAALQAAAFEEADRWNGSALEEIGRLSDSHERALLLNRSGVTDWQLSRRWEASAGRLLARARDSHEQARRIAAANEDPRAGTYALGYLGRIHEGRSELAEALLRTRQAAFLAQKAHLPHALYRWEWQTGRLERTSGDEEAALQAYRRAIQSLEMIRRDLIQSCAGEATFHESVAAMYGEAADLMLRLAVAETVEERRQALLRKARDTMEQRKSAELEDYFRDPCLELALARARDVEQIAERTAVVYLIPLEDRTELLVGLTDGWERVESAVGAPRLAAEVQQFRRHLEKRTTGQYVAGARQLYQWLIEPIKPVLSRQGVRTLVFVPDGALRMIPMAALHDGERFLIEQFAVAVTPGLRLMEPRPMPRGKVQILLGGLSEEVAGYPALPFVEVELQKVRQIFPGRVLSNDIFTHEALRQQFAAVQYQIVHLASHGEFRGESGESFLLTHDGRLTLDQLAALVQPSRYRGRPVELLTLSACQTAAGDERAALGLAGVAVKAGARSALATLWFVNDQSTAILVSSFYQRLRADPTISKAEALQHAQRELLRDRRYQHPCYWAPYLIVGNWL